MALRSGSLLHGRQQWLLGKRASYREIVAEPMWKKLGTTSWWRLSQMQVIIPFVTVTSGPDEFPLTIDEVPLNALG